MSIANKLTEEKETFLNRISEQLEGLLQRAGFKLMHLSFILLITPIVYCAGADIKKKLKVFDFCGYIFDS